MYMGCHCTKQLNVIYIMLDKQFTAEQNRDQRGYELLSTDMQYVQRKYWENWSNHKRFGCTHTTYAMKTSLLTKSSNISGMAK
jgi:hypothetical protein